MDALKQFAYYKNLLQLFKYAESQTHTGPEYPLGKGGHMPKMDFSYWNF